MLAATNPDTSGLTIGYVLDALALAAVLVALLIYAAWATRDGRPGIVERWIDRRLTRRCRAALDRGDRQILLAVEQEAERVPSRVAG